MKTLFLIQPTKISAYCQINPLPELGSRRFQPALIMAQSKDCGYQNFD
jgi:hypothetical protein